MAHDLMEKRGKTESEAIELAVGIIKRWARGGGNVDATTRAAAAKALAEWEKLKAGAHAKAAGGKIKEAVSGVPVPSSGVFLEDISELGDLRVLEAADGDAEDKGDGGADEASETPDVYCVKCRKKVSPTKAGKCPSCGTDLSKAITQAKRVQEAILEGWATALHPRGRGGQFVVKQGSAGAEVRGVQSKLGAKRDGKFGGQTRQAVSAFQRRHGLQVDGIVGAQTVAALRGRARAAKVKVGAMSAADRKWLASIGGGK